MNLMKILNQFLAAILVLIFHQYVGAFMDRSSAAFIVAMYIFVLTMIYIVGLPVEEETGEIQEQEMDLNLEKFNR